MDSRIASELELEVDAAWFSPAQAAVLRRHPDVVFAED